MAEAKPPTLIAKLAEKGSVNEPPNSHSIKLWATSALGLFDKGEQAKLSGDLETAYVHLYKAITIVVNVISKHRDFERAQKDDAQYHAARRKVNVYLPQLEEIRSELKSRADQFAQGRPSFSSAGSAPGSSSDLTRGVSNISLGGTGESNGSGGGSREPRTVVQPGELFGLLKQGAKSVLVLDVRQTEKYLHGHLKWRNNRGMRGGVVNIEPEWLERSGTTSADISTYLMSFGQSSSMAKSLFESRNQFDMVIYLDDHSTNPDTSPTLRRLMSILYEQPQNAPKLRPLLLAGGQRAWESFVKDSGEWQGDWVEIGDGVGISERSEENAPQNAVPAGSGIARSAYDFVASKNQQQQQTYVQKPLTHPQPTHQPLQQQQQNGYHPHNPFNNITNIPLGGTSNSAMPVIVPVTQQSTQYYQAPSIIRNNSSGMGGQQTRRFEDPFYFTPRSDSAKRMAVIGNVYAPPSSVPPTTMTYPNLAPPNTSLAPSSSPISPVYPSPSSMGAPSVYPAPAAPPKPLALQPHNHPGVISIPPPAFPQPPSRKNSSPLLQRRPPLGPPLALESAPPAMFRRSSSPSGSPSTARFYGMTAPPPIPNKPSGRLAGPIAHSYSSYDTGLSEFVPYSQMGSSLMGMSGMKNLGNTCFMSSIIQCLAGTVPLARYFLDGSYRKHVNRKNTLGTKGEVADAFAELAKTMWTGQEGSVVTPTKFKQVIGTHHPSFRGNEQQDSQEFLAFFLDSLHEDLNVARTPAAIAEVKANPEKEQDDEGVPDEIILDKTWQRYRKLNWSIIVDLFQGSLKSKLQCLTCGKSSTTFNPFMYLTLPIPPYNQAGKKNGPLYLQECLDKFVEEEILEGDDAWRCPRCKVPRKSTKTLTIAKLPIILLIHLKRFYYSGPFRNRIDTYVEFPITSLDLTKYLPAAREPFVYDCYGVSSHFGGLNGGHYTAQVKHSYKGNQWFNFDDSRISKTDDKSVKSPAAYILFYHRQMNGQRTSTNWWNANGPQPVGAGQRHMM
ncbi:uncharacterized protein EV422DRAFT_315915 [Fimicolochytrium jonesii]|uniref:uncharacterized protein n=1 Tax=Fimicolochytrium jonesii TaxID=1396493 RepID=UPI0022FF0F7C|nr:uncharacterized protein EV422DRAFT_315915 [Fimicolochytrium jonesii]KAI8824311.1 hypothetical protein EV422DRAFT_315915 [Fimicolochytrium jonesii]